MIKPSARFMVMILSFILLLSISGIDIYVPAIPIMAKSFSTSKQTLQFTISIFLAGMAVAQLFTAGLSDFFGRKKVLLLTLLVYFLVSFICIFLSSAKWFTIARFMQGVACGSVSICVFSIARDLFQGERLVKSMSYMTAIISLAPVIAPLIGGIIAAVFMWQAVFICLSLAIAAVFLIIYLYLPETHHETESAGSYLTGIMVSVTNKRYVIYSLTVALTYASYFAYLCNVSLIYNTVFHFKVSLIAVLIGCNAIALFLSGIGTAYLIKLFNYKQIATTSLSVVVMSSVFLLTLNNTLAQHSLFLFMLCSFINILSVAITVIVLMSQALSAVKSYVGVAVGLSGFVRYGLCFGIGSIIAWLGFNSITAVGVIFLVASLISFLLLYASNK